MLDYLNPLGQMEKQTEEIQDKVKKDFQTCFNTESGQEVIKHLSKITAFNEPLGPQDANTLAYVNGQRDLFRIILSYSTNTKGN